MIRVSGNFTQTLSAWMINQQIECPELTSQLALMANRDAIPIQEWQTFLDRAVRLAPNQPVGIQVGAQVQVSHTGVLGYLVLNSETLADALETYLLCEHHFYSHSLATLNRNDAEWTLSWPDRLGSEYALFGQVAISALVTFLRKRFPGGCQLCSVSLSGEPPEHVDVFENFFGCPVSFGPSRPAVSFSTDTIHKPTPGLLAGDFHAMRLHQQEAIGTVIKINDPFLHRFTHVLLRHIPKGKATLKQVAQDLNCSPRTTQRMLKRSNLSYQQLLDGLREQLALRYLLHTSLTLAEISVLIGYSDQSAFNRAFLKWNGATPGRYRKKRGNIGLKN